MLILAGALLVAPLAASSVLAAQTIRERRRTRARSVPDRKVQLYGEIESIDMPQGTITVLHVPLEDAEKFFQMPVMTMVFHMANKNGLKGLKAGDWVSFEAVRRGNTAMVTSIRKVRLEGSRSIAYEL